MNKMFVMRNKPAHAICKQIMRMHVIMFLWIPLTTPAEWLVNTHQNEDSRVKTNIAYSKNVDGYALEIYRDSVNAIRSRFTIPDGLIELVKNSCPTYQIDRGMPQNRSTNDVPCLSNTRWSEFILGYVENKNIPSSTLLALMNGITITYRFILANGDYRETVFSLYGSKRALLSALGEDITVTPSR